MSILAVPAVFSECRQWRYTLVRKTGVVSKGTSVGLTTVRMLYPRTVLFVCLNPSTADETQDDPTVRRCLGFARKWGFEQLVVCNVFAIRSTDPKMLRYFNNPTGPDNDFWIRSCAEAAEMIVCAWGVHGAQRRRGEAVRQLLEGQRKPLHHLGLTKDGHPKHPLYLRSDSELFEWRR